ncbi:two-component system response regulator ResD [Orenia metallireducens]|uniref:Stage 0 sporulation protein A homolog n=1 Tax=Orenia metallireducens TaxID=1413210 RepID=A0A285HUD0_9FIRM|nr:response regulator transcription factor [Orenia metallireducens]PRX30974.1 two-component system response regulator ResD [Orenia metallireducens]SNY39310.1 two-component system, OmpR family, response regulator ResD [Orenia metallireducens]
MEDKKILIVDDDKNVLEILSLYLNKENFRVLTAKDGKEAISKVGEVNPDLIILDIMMPKIDGLEVLKILRKDNEIPVILLSAKGEEFDRILGLEIGADDYVTKPFSPREVLARVKVILKRVTKARAIKERSDLISYPHLTIDPQERRVEVDGGVVDLSPKEYQLLLLLARHPKQVFKREQLCDRIWGIDYYGDMRTVDVHINWLRDKLDLDYIKTVWGVGYKFEVQADV